MSAARDAAPDLGEQIDFLRGHYGKDAVKVKALVTKDGQQFGNCTPDFLDGVPECWDKPIPQDPKPSHRGRGK